MSDLDSVRDRVLRLAFRTARSLPGAAGGMGVYFSAQQRLAEDPRYAGWRRDVATMLRRADRRFLRGHVASALRWYDKALRISYDPSLHQTGGSPLAQDPDAFLRPLRKSALGTVLLDGTVPEGTAPPRPAPRRRGEDEPLRLVVVAQENWTFMRPLLAALRATGRYEVQEIEVDDLPDGGFPDRERIIRGRYDLLTTGRRMPTPPALVEAFEWADVVLVEWSHHVLTWMTLLDRAPRRLMARIHRFEAFTPFVLLHDHRRIDRMLYVSPPVWAMLTTIAPGYSDVPSSQVGNLLARGVEQLPREAHDPHLLVQIGWIREVKDVLFSLDVLTRLRQHDERYRLQLVGPALHGDEARDTPYQRRVRAALGRFPDGVVEQLGVRDDVPSLLAQSGAILSSSRHEGTHESLMEALVVGCPAVIREWPDTVAYGGPATLYRPDWVVADADAAAQRILELADPQRYREESADAREFALAHRDPAVVVAGYERVLQGPIA
ncbi:glycosyltransferase [Brachybacterium alimentarium]|uniref:glycosyltransferase n=1 Tax=Brachybacterium alimentarium TaxID=47845 RepID=UPI003FD6AAD1